jgi:peptidoglycan biosynthesis protein MviN/MurJ (putative lipid II flippase)
LILSALFLRKGTDIVLNYLSIAAGRGVFASFDYALTIFLIPHSLIAISVSQVFYTDFVNKNAEKNIQKSLEYILFMSLPATALLITLRAQLVRIFNGSGNFDWESTRSVVTALLFLSFSISLFNIIAILNRIFYAQHKSTVPTIGWIISILTVFSVGWLFLNNDWLHYDTPRINGSAAIAIAYTTSNVTQFAFLVFCLKRVTNFRFALIIPDSLKIAFISLIMGIISYGALNAWDRIGLPTDTLFSLIGQAGFATICALIIFLSLAYSLKLDIVRDLIHRLNLNKYIEPAVKFIRRI